MLCADANQPLYYWIDDNVLGAAQLLPYKSKGSHMCIKCQKTILKHQSKPHIEMILI